MQGCRRTSERRHFVRRPWGGTRLHRRGGSCTSNRPGTYLVTAPLLGRLADRLGRRRVLVVSLLLFTLANFATALAPNYPLLVVARVVAGAAAAGTGPTIYALCSATAPANRRATHLALVGSGLLSALWAGAPLGDVLGHHLGWQYVFAVLALAAVCAGATP
nr:MFS transporter [Streptomyces canus]